MSDLAPSHQAAILVAAARESYQQGDLDFTLSQLRQAVLLYASEIAKSPLHRENRADACQFYADCLTEREEHAEAANVYQEAVDLYSLLDTPRGEAQAQLCARKILAGVAALRSRPHERLYLLIAHYERQQQQLSLQKDTEREQAALVVHIARIFQRRERYQEAVTRYREALQLYLLAAQTQETLLDCAECLHRIANLLDRYLNDPAAAIRHYREAIALYAAHEPVVHGRQAGRDLCVRALRLLEQANDH